MNKAPKEKRRSFLGSLSGKSNNSTSTSATDSSSSSNYEKRSRSVVWGRGIFLCFLLVVAGCLGGLAFYLLSEPERHLVDEQYFSMTGRALEATKNIATNKLQHGTMVMAKVASYAFPDAAAWPFIWVEGYLDIVASVIPTSCYTGMHLAPIVPPDRVAEFETFAYTKFAETFGENTTTGAQSHFGKGIWVQDSRINTTDNRYHDTTGISMHGSPYQLIAPKFQHALGDKSPYVMMNVHGFKTQAGALDSTINCTKFERPNDPTKTCQALSAMHTPLVKNGIFDEKGTFAFISTPIYPQHDPDTLVGFIFGAIWWVEVMEEVFPAEAEGIDCVLKASFADEDDIYSYTIQEGSGKFLGKGDLHDTKWDDYKMEKLLMEPGSMADSSAVYTLTCYPNDSFPSNYQTNNPIVAAVGSVIIILFTSFLFFAYDRCVRKEFDGKKELLEAKRQFVRFVSHEVRTPLNSVCMGLTLMTEEMAQSFGFKSAVEMMSNKDKQTEDTNTQSITTNKNDSAADKEWFNLANEILTNTQCAVNVLNDLLNYDKIENGQLSLEMTVIPIWKLLERTVMEFKLPMASKNITMHFQLPELSDTSTRTPTKKLQDQKVIGDTVRITQVLRNLISNAIKFTPEKGDIYIEAKWRQYDYETKERIFDVKPRDRVTLRSSGELVVTVRDTGAGMTKDQLKRLFGQGVQFNVNELQHGNGSGLGLYIAMGIVEQHEGTIKCDSEGLGHGTTFTMTMPVYDMPKDDDDNDSKKAPESDSSFSDPKLKILIVDDVTSNRKLLSRLLATKGHECDQADDGQVCVAMVQAAKKAGKKYDMVLLDYEMPTMNGPTAAQKVRERGSDVFIVGVTGNLMPEDVTYFRSCGADAVLPKPIRMADLDSLIFEHNITGGESGGDHSHSVIGTLPGHLSDSNLSMGSDSDMPWDCDC